MTEIIQELDVLEIIKKIGKRSKKSQAVILQKLEEILGKDSQEFEEIRKIILDEFNNFTRASVREIFGDIEYLLK